MERTVRVIEVHLCGTASDAGERILIDCSKSLDEYDEDRFLSETGLDALKQEAKEIHSVLKSKLPKITYDEIYKLFLEWEDQRHQRISQISSPDYDEED